MKKILSVIAVIFLAGCGASASDQAASLSNVNSQLPKGCKVTYLGNVSIEGSVHPSRIFITTCNNGCFPVTSNERHVVSNGKSTSSVNSANIDFSQCK